MSHKTALVLSWGGCAMAFSTWILFSLLDEYDLRIDDIDMMFVWSAGCSLWMFFLCDRVEERKRDGMEHFVNKNLINPLRFWNIVNLDYFVDDICGKRYGMTTSELQKRSESVPLYIGVTDAHSGEAKVFGAHEWYTSEIIKASMSLPVVCAREVPINWRRYFDGIFSQSPEFLTMQAFARGADNVIVITPSLYSKKNAWYVNAWTYTRSKQFRENQRLYEQKKQELHELYGMPNEWIKESYSWHVLYLWPEQQHTAHGMIDMNLVAVKTSILSGKVHGLWSRYINHFLWRVI